MATQSSPGIRITEVDNTLAVAQAAPPAGAIAGSFRWGPVEEVRTVTSEDELVRVFGKPDNDTASYFFTAANFLAYSNALRVVRVANSGSYAATASASTTRVAAAGFTINTSSAVLTTNAAVELTPGQVLQISNASSNVVTVTVLSVTNTTQAILTTTPTEAVASGNAFSFGLAVKNADQYEANFSTGSTTVGSWAAKYPGSLGNSLRVELCGGANAYSSSYTQSAANVTMSGAGVTVLTVSSDVTATLKVGDVITANGQERVVLAVNASHITVNTAFSGVLTGAAFSRRWAYSTLFGAAPGTSDYAVSAGATNDELHVVVVDEDGLISGTANTVLEKYAFVSKARDAKTQTGSSNYYKEVINRQSPYVWWLNHPTNATSWGNLASGTSFASLNAKDAVSLNGGTDANALADADVNRGYNLFVPEQVEVSFLLGGPASVAVASHLVSNVIGVKKFVMGFLSPRQSDVVNAVGLEATNVLSFRDSLPSSSYVVLDSGWKYQYDKYNDVYRYVPLNGDVAGCVVRTHQIADPWISPAGVVRGQIKNVIKLAWNPTEAERDRLYLKGVNPVVSLPGQGTILYGDKTLLSKPSAFDRINVRGLFIALQQQIGQAAQALLFEQNDEYTRNTFVNLVEPYLRQVKGRRGISDFFVVCDATNNPGDAIDRGEFRGDIYVKPIRSVNFLQLNFTAVRSDVAFTEVVTNLQ
jgi:hypothetical protein